MPASWLGPSVAATYLGLIGPAVLSSGSLLPSPSTTTTTTTTTTATMRSPRFMYNMGCHNGTNSNALESVETTAQASSSSELAVDTSPMFAFDGNTSTRWAANRYFADPSWIQLDFSEGPRALASVDIWWEQAHAARYKVLALFKDGSAATAQKAGEEGWWHTIVPDIALSSPIISSHDVADIVAGRQALAVRIVCLERALRPWGCSVLEVRLNDLIRHPTVVLSNASRPATSLSAKALSIRPHADPGVGTKRHTIQVQIGGRRVSALAKASSVFGHTDTLMGPQQAFDGLATTRWAAKANSKDHEMDWLELEFFQPQAVETVAIHWEDSYATNYDVVFIAAHGPACNKGHHSNHPLSEWGVLIPPSPVSSPGIIWHEDLKRAPPICHLRIRCLNRRLSSWGCSIFDVEINRPRPKNALYSVAAPLPKFVQSDLSSTHNEKPLFGVAIPVAPRTPHMYVHHVIDSLPNEWPLSIMSRVENEEHLCTRYAKRLQSCFSPPRIHEQLDNDKQLNEKVRFGGNLFTDSQTRARWRSHLVLDCAMMLEHAASQFRYFLYLEDDVALSTTAAEEILGIVQSMAKTRPNQDSISGQAIVKLCVGGMLGIIYDSRVVPYLVREFRNRFDEKPADWLLLTVKSEMGMGMAHRVNDRFGSKMLLHLGEYSTFQAEKRDVDQKPFADAHVQQEL